VARLHLIVNFLKYLHYRRGSTDIDPQISSWGGYFVVFGAIRDRLLG